MNKGVRKIALERGKEMTFQRRGSLNLLFLRQSYLQRRLHAGQLQVLGEYLQGQSDIQHLLYTHVCLDESHADNCF